MCIWYAQEDARSLQHINWTQTKDTEKICLFYLALCLRRVIKNQLSLYSCCKNINTGSEERAREQNKGGNIKIILNREEEKCGKKIELGWERIKLQTAQWNNLSVDSHKVILENALAERYKDTVNLSMSAQKACTPEECLCVSAATLKLGKQEENKERASEYNHNVCKHICLKYSMVDYLWVQNMQTH